MKRSIITISRQFGSGGRSIAKEVAQRLEVPYYDKELVKQVALETGLDEGYVEDQGEHAPVGGVLGYSFAARGLQGPMQGMSAADFLWVMQRRVILDLAEKGPCVIVGRCSDYILKDREDCLHVFIHAGLAFRAERIVRLYGESDKSPEKRLQDKDKRRRGNYRHFTDREWGMAQNYHLALDSGVLGLERCAEVILDLAKG